MSSKEWEYERRVVCRNVQSDINLVIFLNKPPQHHSSQALTLPVWANSEIHQITIRSDDADADDELTVQSRNSVLERDAVADIYSRPKMPLKEGIALIYMGYSEGNKVNRRSRADKGIARIESVGFIPEDKGDFLEELKP
jgi:hypothetical protein